MMLIFLIFIFFLNMIAQKSNFNGLIRLINDRLFTLFLVMDSYFF